MYRILLLLPLFLNLVSESSAQYGGPSHGSSALGWRYSRSRLRDNHISDLDYNLAKAAGKNLTYFYRMENSVGYTLAPGTFEHHYYRTSTAPEGGIVFDTAYTLTGVGKGGIYITNTSGFPLMTLSRSSAVIVTYGASLRLNRFVTPVMKFDGLETVYKVKTTDMGGILTLDYKSGAEAMLDRGLRTCFTFGAGIEPTWFQAEIRPTDGSDQLVVLPLLKAEFGLAFAKTALKLRLSCNPGKGLVYYESRGSWYQNPVWYRRDRSRPVPPVRCPHRDRYVRQECLFRCSSDRQRPPRRYPPDAAPRPRRCAGRTDRLRTAV